MIQKRLCLRMQFQRHQHFQMVSLLLSSLCSKNELDLVLARTSSQKLEIVHSTKYPVTSVPLFQTTSDNIASTTKERFYRTYNFVVFQSGYIK